jgi:Ca-activated chloride channel homolog
VGTFHFIHPQWLLALPPLLAFAAWCARSGRKDAAWGNLIDPELLGQMRLPGASAGQSPWGLLAVLWTFAVLALASPSWERRTISAYQAPAAWVLVLDLSPTMAATDVSPDRVTRARYAVADLLTAAHDVRVGLVVFAGEPHIVTPLTSDVATVRTLLQPLAPKLMPESGDNVAPALDEASHLLAASHFSRGHVVVLTDGFADPAKAMLVAQRLRASGSTVDVIGIGTTDGMLQRVAAAGGGQYFSLNDMPRLIEELRDDANTLKEVSSPAKNLMLTTWLNEGFWLIPPMLLIGALIARRGWV